MKSILSLIALAYLIQFSLSETEVPSVTILEDGIIADFTSCAADENQKTKLSFSIAVTTEGFENAYTFKMGLAEPKFAYAECTVGEKESEPTRSTSETEYMECVVDSTLFAIYNTKVSLLTNYGGDGTFEMLGWAEVFGTNNVVVDYTSGDVDGCYPKNCTLSFTPSKNIVDTCEEDGKHDISITGELKGEFKGALSFMAWYSIGENKYGGSTCTLQEPASKTNESDLELKCTIQKDTKSIQFFDTIPYDEKAGQFVWIIASEKYELKDCSKPEPEPGPGPEPGPEPEPEPKPVSSSYITLSALLLLSLLF